MQKKQSSHTFFLTYRIKNVISLCLLSLVLAGCQTPPLNVQYAMDEDLDLKRYQTFSIEPISYQGNPFVEYINLGIETVLSEKGYRLSDDPDFIIRYSLTIEGDQELRLDPVRVNGVSKTKPIIESVFEAKMLINAIDAQTEKVLWKAATSRDISSVNTKKIEQAKVNKRIEELLESFSSR